MKMEPRERFKVILRMATSSQLVTMFAAGDKSRLRDVAKRVHLRYSGKEVTEEQATGILKACLALRHGEHLLKLVFALSESVADTAEKLLGDAFVDPTQDDLDGLTPKLVRQHGRLLTMLYYARVVASNETASAKVKIYFDSDGLFDVKADDSKPIPLPKPKLRSVDNVKKELRKQRKSRRKKPVVAVKSTARKKHIKVKPKPTVKLTTKTAATPILRKVIEPKRLVHPHITPGKGVSQDDKSVSSVVMAHISYKPKDSAGGGKLRPCLVIAAGEKFLLVRPIYTNPRKYAQHWRSVHLEEWHIAGLEHQSYVSIQRQVVLRRRSSPIGQLSVHDWNKVCRGEVNSVGDL